MRFRRSRPEVDLNASCGRTTGGRVLRFPGTHAGFERAFADFRRILDAHDLQTRTRYNSELVFEEIVTNIIRHGYADDQEHEIALTLLVHDGDVTLGFEDDGAAFDPRDRPSDPRAGSGLDAREGGHGLGLVRKATRRIDYERTPDERNRLTISIAGGS
jgi:serine/threonine-protein kinase RsbW